MDARKWVGAAVMIVGCAGAGFYLTRRTTCCTLPPPVASDSSATSVPSPQPTTNASLFQVAGEGSATFLIDAPLEKIKGQSRRVRGAVDIDARDLRATRGKVEFDLGALTTTTFGDEGKDATQTEHARNWLEANDSPTEQNRWATFTISSVSALPAGGTVSGGQLSLAAVPEVAGRRKVRLVVAGTFRLHGITVQKQVSMDATFEGPAEAPTRVILATVEPFRVSLKEHDVKPRDLAGAFLQGALEKVGKKIDDSVQISVSLEVARTTPAALAAPPSK